MKFWKKVEDEEQPVSCFLVLKSRGMEAVVIHAAEFFTAGELDILQQVSISLSVCVKDWQTRDILYELDRETWKDVSEDWHTYTCWDNGARLWEAATVVSTQHTTPAKKKSKQKCVAETGQDGIHQKMSTRNHQWPGVRVNVFVT